MSDASLETPPSFGAAEFKAATGVDDMTLALLSRYEAVLRDWNSRINLVSVSSLHDLWRRHFLDSAQLVPLMPETATRVLDLGSGAGLPGLVVALLLRDRHDAHVTLVESIEKKCAFLRAASSALGLDRRVSVHRGRIEDLGSGRVDVVTARAVAPLETLLRYAQRFVDRRSLCLFPKGQSAGDELTRAGETWRIDAKLIRSLSDPTGSIVAIQAFSFKGHKS